ncbi:hypothetical protein ABIA09_003758 [Bradyrhizobium yuanmingense]
MFSFSDLFQWDRFITPTIIKTFYWLVIALICLFGLSGIFSGLAAMAISPFGGFLVLLSSIASVVVGIVFSRIVAELILIVSSHQRASRRDPGPGNRDAVARHSGAPRRGEPGIHRATEQAYRWIPGSRFARPGMTSSYVLNLKCITSPSATT